MLTDYYTVLTIKEKLDAGRFGVTEQVVGYYKGFIQPVSSSETFMQGKSADSTTHRLYTGLSTPVEKDYLIEQGASKYIVTDATFQPTGISGVNDHKEILLRVVK